MIITYILVGIYVLCYNHYVLYYGYYMFWYDDYIFWFGHWEYCNGNWNAVAVVIYPLTIMILQVNTLLWPLHWVVMGITWFYNISARLFVVLLLHLHDKLLHFSCMTLDTNNFISRLCCAVYWSSCYVLLPLQFG